MKSVVSLMFLVFFGSITFSNVIVVSTTGNDSNPGTENMPFATIQAAFNVAQAGDSILLRHGIYYQAAISQSSGTLAEPIVFCAWPSESVQINGNGISDNNGIIINHDGWHISNIEILNWNDTGLWISGNIGNIIVNNCKIHDAPYCLSLSDGVHDFIIEFCETYNFGPSNGGGDGFGFSCEPNGIPCYNGIIRFCKSYHGRSALANNDGFALGHQNVSNITFLNCETYEVFDGFDISGHNILLRNCLAHDILEGGDGAFKIWPDSVTLINCMAWHSVSNVQLDYDGRQAVANLINCTFHDASVYNIWIENPETNHLKMYNCLITGGDNRGLVFEIENYANYSGDYNLFQNDNSDRVISTPQTDISISNMQSGQWTNLSGQDSHSLFIESSSGVYVNDNNLFDLHLLTGSLAINSGSSDFAPSTDINDCLRNDGQPDLGAYEYGCISEVESSSQNSLFHPFPNPVNDILKLGQSSNYVRIIDLSGKIVLEHLKPIEQISVIALKNGLYLLETENFNTWICIQH